MKYDGKAGNEAVIQTTVTPKKGRLQYGNDVITGKTITKSLLYRPIDLLARKKEEETRFALWYCNEDDLQSDKLQRRRTARSDQNTGQRPRPFYSAQEWVPTSTFDAP